MTRKLVVTRRVTLDESPWLDREFLPGETLYVCSRYDYGCVNNEVGFAATLDPSGDYPFFEFPFDAVVVVPEG